ncbi:hypothetical protein BGZ46_005203, partial [Entomortierella lignicola]
MSGPQSQESHLLPDLVESAQELDNDIYEKYNKDAIYDRGLAYYKGSDVPQNFVRAFDLFQIAANKGHAVAHDRLRKFEKSREGSLLDYSYYIERYRTRAEGGSANDQCNLGFMYEIGFDLTMDPVKALEWYQKAAEQEHA